LTQQLCDSPTQCGRKGGEPAQEAIGRSKGGLSTKIHATVDALGNPLSFHLTPGQACDLDGADKLLPDPWLPTPCLQTKDMMRTLRVLDQLQRQGKTPVIPPKRNRTTLRAYDKDLYKARHLIENFFCSPNSSSIERLRRAMTNALPTFWVQFIWLLLLFG
jgi:transposase